MAARVEPLLMTVEQFAALPERQDVLEELHWGLLVTLSRPKAWPVKLQMKLTQLLQPAAAGSILGQSSAGCFAGTQLE
jgi:hypothetical protein